MEREEDELPQSPVIMRMKDICAVEGFKCTLMISKS
jgi:hypothetical protein